MRIPKYIRNFTLLLLLVLNSGIDAKEYKREATFFPTILTFGKDNPGPTFGVTVKKNRDFIFVAAPITFESFAGAVYVFKKKGTRWVRTQILTNSADNILGAVQIDSQKDWLVISCVGTTGTTGPDNKGSVLVFRLNEESSLWERTQVIDNHTPGLEDLSPATVSPPSLDTENGALFGFFFSLDAEHGHLLVGAENQQKKKKVNAGAVYAFDLNQKTKQWEFIQKITRPEGAHSNGNFGANVAINGDLALIGTGGVFPIIKTSSGSVYVFQRHEGKWRFRQRIRGDQHTATTMKAFNPFIPVDPSETGDGFGASLATNGKWAVVSAPFENKSPQHQFAGAVYFYKVHQDATGKKSLKRINKAFSDDPTTNLTGLLHVDVSGDTIAVADAGRTGPKGPRQGGILIYHLKNGKWRQKEVVYDPKGHAFDYFGEGVSLTKQHLVGGCDDVFFTFIGLELGLPLPIPAPNPLKANKAVLFKREH